MSKKLVFFDGFYSQGPFTFILLLAI